MFVHVPTSHKTAIMYIHFWMSVIENEEKFKYGAYGQFEMDFFRDKKSEHQGPVKSAQLAVDLESSLCKRLINSTEQAPKQEVRLKQFYTII